MQTTTTAQSFIQQQQSQGKQSLTKSLNGPKTPKRTGVKNQQEKTPPEEKLKRIENEIGKRSAMQDLMYRQRQLEDAVKDARRVNIMIEEEKERMRQLKSRMMENNLSQYVTITKQELKNTATAKGGKRTATTAGGKTADNAENDSDQDSLPGLIPPIDERRKKVGENKKASKVVTSENMFDDNYAFYMYYLNTSGQLVTPVEQMFQDNAAKQEQIRKLQEELDKKSRVVKPKQTESAQENTASKKKQNNSIAQTKAPQTSSSHRESNQSNLNKKPEQSRQSSPNKPLNQSQPPPTKRNFLKKTSPAPPARASGKTAVKETISQKQESIENSFERSTSKGEQLVKVVNQQQQPPIKNENQQDVQTTPAKKFQFLKRTAKATVPTPKSRSQTRATPSRNKQVKTSQSVSQDLVNVISQTQEPEILQDEAHRVKSLDENSPQFQLHPIEKISPEKKKKPLLKNTLISNPSNKFKTIQSPGGAKTTSPAKNSRYNSVDQKEKTKGPQILIKKSSTIMPEEQTNQDDSSLESVQNEQSITSNKQKSPLKNKVISQKNRQSIVKASIDTTDSASTLHLPPLVKTSQLISSSSYTSSSQQSLPVSKLIPPRKPPKPVNNNNQQPSSLHQIINHKKSTDSITTLPSLTSHTLQQHVIEQSHNQSSTSLTQNNASRPSSTRSSRIGHNSMTQVKEISHMGMNEERRAKEKAKRDKQIEYANQIQQIHKPKVDKHKQMEIEIRQNSVTLDYLEIQARENPIKKVQLSDLL